MTLRGEGAAVVPDWPGLVAELEERLKSSEEKLRHAQKLATLGTLVAGVTHDFNNALLIVLTNAGVMLARIDPADRRREEIRDIYDAAVRAGALTRKLLPFARRRPHQPKLVAVDDVLDGVERLLARLLGGDVALTVLRGHAGAVHADPGELEQVVTNLVVNARDAMPMGGRITIETRDVDVNGSHPEATPGRYVRLAVTDTGVGMDDATKARIFEPFFTTKEPGRGTGLGLQITREIVERCGGFIDVRSAPHNGTTFAVHLPRAAGPVSVRSAPEIDPSLRGQGTVLLTAGDDHVRAALRGVLELHGYDVLEARNAGEAILIEEQYVGPIDLLITEVVLPLMSGAALAERLTRRRPSLRALFVSDDPDEPALRRAAVLAKPFTPVALLDKVRDVLGGER